MDILRPLSIMIFIACVCHSMAYSVVPREDMQLKLLRQEHMPSIEYKYLVRTILPTENRWWRRGTHKFYAEEPAPKVIGA